MSDRGEVSESGLDAYSRIVTSVAENLRSRVAALTVDTVIRGTHVARGAGSGVVFTGDGFVLTNAHVVSAGASSHLPLVQVKNLPRHMDALKNRGVWLYGAAGEATLRPEQLDWDRPAALVIGSEGAGMRRLVREGCDELVAVPMRGKIASLNASVAAGVLLYAALTARRR